MYFFFLLLADEVADGIASVLITTKKSKNLKTGLAALVVGGLLLASGLWYGNELTQETGTKSSSFSVNAKEASDSTSADNDPNENNDYTSSALADEIIELPGINVETLNFRQFSGYLDANDGRQLFYWFVESQDDPLTDPLIMWTNGKRKRTVLYMRVRPLIITLTNNYIYIYIYIYIGLLGLLSEHGPFWVDPNLQLYVNEYSWNTKANIFYIEQPYGVGFSVLDANDSYVTGDKNASLDMDAAIRSFLVKFPKYSKHPFSISGIFFQKKKKKNNNK
ncbi:hypothetical protein RFI_16249 [Reticulomyxa filosa]|uniref:Uncharacterized protein n=1 Tax=Reticulomyxa filosa TaxID=46433 RepID=X6N3V6_RETFI|nr:hypothetical protein RFI_16249 [Reticulomyxa filosa]|eukprot:ETO20955.1 hypothetical protein RFI_16249 [Reticulomyxa filosa]